MPEVGQVKFEVETLEKEVAVINDADIEKVLNYLKEQNTSWEKVDKAAAEKDQVVVDFSGSIDGKPFSGGQAHDYPIVLGSKMMIPGFEEGIIGMKANEERNIKVTFPENYFAKEVAGKEADFLVKVLSVSQPQQFEFNEQIVKKLGIKSGQFEDLRAEIRKNLERELDRVIKQKLKASVFDKLIEQNPLEIPKALIEKEAARIHDEMHPHHHDHAHTEAENEMFNKAALRNVTLGLLIAEIAKQQKISADSARVQTYLTSMAAAYQNPAEVMKWYENNKRAYAEIEMQVLEDQVIELLLKEVKVVEKMLSYNELIGTNAQD